MKVIILGVGRSGTTALYTLLQKVISEQISSDVEYVYEPFLWDYKSFNDKLENVSSNFQYVDAVSHEGIYNHKTLPLYIENPKSYADNAFLKKILQADTGKSYLAKFIRANGRYALLNEISPDAKTIFLVRNPIDVVNSVITKFSFFGGEFHQDDFPRFLKETNTVFKTNFKKTSFKNQVEKELAFWYYMNLFAFNSFKQSTNKPLIICYDEYVKAKTPFIKNICKHVGLKYSSKYTDVAREKVGPVTESFHLPEAYKKVMTEYLKKYFRLLNDNNIEHSFAEKDILSKYSFTQDASLNLNKNYGFIPLLINEKSQKLETEVHTKEEELNKLKKEYDEKIELGYKKDAEIKWYESKVSELNFQVSSIDKEKGELENKINGIEKETSLYISDLEDMIQRNEVTFNNLKAEYDAKIEEGYKKEGEIKWYQDKVSELNKEVATLTDEKQKIEDKITNLEKETERKSSEYEHLKAEFSQKVELLYKKEGEIQWYQEKVKETESQAVLLETAKEKLETRLVNYKEESERKITELESKIKDQEITFEDLKNKYRQKEDLFYKKEGEIQWYQGHIKGLEEQNAGNKNFIIQKDNVITQQSDFLNTLINENQKNKALIEEKFTNELLLKQENFTLSTKNEKLETEVQKLRELSEINNGTLKWYENNTAKLSDDITEKNKIVKETQEELWATTGKLKWYEDNTLKINSELKEVREELYSSNGKINWYETNTPKLNAELLEKNRLLDGLKKQALEKNGLINLYKENTSILQEELGKLDLQVEENVKMILQKEASIKKQEESIKKQEDQLGIIQRALEEKIKAEEQLGAELAVSTKLNLELNDKINSKEEELKKYILFLKEKEEEVYLLKTQIQKNERIIKGEMDIKQALNTLMEQKDKEISSKEQLINTKINLINQKEEELEIIYNSQSWKIGNGFIKLLKTMSGYNLIKKLVN